jgi:membrane protease YdiL (CAAX protease family)
VRGYVLNNLMLSVNKYLALLISSVAFAAMHIPNPHFSLITFFILVLSGIILGLSYLFTRNLWFPIALHFSWNFFQGTVFGFNVSGQDDYSLIEQFRAEDNIINGGLFGFEGSLLCIGMLILGTFIVWKIFYTKDPPFETSPSAEELIGNQDSIL